ncbi:SDR family NAD(P)-dependent oxidoreductase [Pseudonocardia sp. 73-21]|uniref:SDR family NAD(P)-dependent oxidoreductase n=1 Tax=Pseudonocardia sp. 73-21 TaxID=1895809 RepID=UPI000963F16B|nr:SDR family NAD(P)-dependent oxidoreductase [Pseudonocardia sp. 73-21]OJY43773.1 MAG: short-chain dehydrogenase [Pseudonocardia sp. 73-21]
MDPQLPDLTGTVALVTGAGGGIGGGVAARFAAAGAAVVVHHRTSAARAAAVVADIVDRGGHAVAAQGDVADPEECAAVVGVAVERFGRLDAVVAAAGVQPVADLAGMSPDEWQRVVDTNLTGSFTTVQAAVPVMSDGGSITLTASVEGSRPARGHAHYSASKAGMIMFARSAALEYGGRGIRVNTVSPGLVDRDGLEDDWPSGVASWRRQAPLARLGTASEVGDACVFLASPMARWITGHDLVVDGGMSAVPAW